MGLFSEELAILDRNTTLLMIDEMQEEVKEWRRRAEETEKEKNTAIRKLKSENSAALHKKDAELSRQAKRIAELEALLSK